MFRRVILVGILLCSAILLTGCFETFVSLQDELLQKPDYTLTQGAPYCANSWPYELRRGVSHIHTVASNSIVRSTNLLENIKGDYDHLFVGDAEEALRNYTFDFVGFADHGEKVTPGEWGRLQEQASAYKQGRVAVRGFEWTNQNPKNQHLVIYGTEKLAGAWIENEDESYEYWQGERCSELKDIYQWLSNQPDNWVACYAHPWLDNTHFNDFVLSGNEKVRSQLALIEVGGGANSVLALGEAYYKRALAQQNWVSPVYGIDNEWRPGKDDAVQTFAWCRKDGGFDYDDVIDAFLGRRTFVSLGVVDDLRFAAKPESTKNYLSFGQALVYQQGEAIEWQCRVSHKQSLVGIDLQGVASDGSLRAFSLNANLLPNKGRPGVEVFTLRFVPPENMSCYYIRVRGTFDKVLALSAPIWINRIKTESKSLFDPENMTSYFDEPYCDELSTIDMNKVDLTMKAHFQPGDDFGFKLTVNSKYPVVCRVSDLDDYNKVLYCRAFSRRGQTAVWYYKNSSNENLYFAIHILYKQGNVWVGHKERRSNFNMYEQNYEFDDDYCQPDVRLEHITNLNP